MRREIIKPALDAYAKTLAREFKHDRSKTIGASEIGQCERKVFWSKKKRQPDDDHGDLNGKPYAARSDYGAGLRGTIMEDRFWYPAMRARYGKSLKYAGPHQRTFQDGLLSATPDGLVVDAPWAVRLLGRKDLSAQFMVECKTVDPRINITEEKTEHSFQVQSQMGLVRKTTRWRPEFAVISYIDASFWHEVDEYVVEFRPEVFEAAEARAERIYAATKGEELRPEGWIAGGKECEHCPFWRSCGVTRRRVEEQKNLEADPQFRAEIVDLCTVANEQKKIAEAAASDYRSTQEDIKERLREKKTRRLEGVVNWFPVKGRMSYDMEGLLAAAEAKGVKTEEFCQVGEPSDQLRILL